MGSIRGNTISYLYKISEALPQCLPTPKSYYAAKSRILELGADCVLPKKLTKSRVRCPRCCLKLTDYTPNVRLRPKPKQKRFVKRMLRKIEDNEPLTNYQQKFKQCLSKVSQKSALVATCQICKMEIKKEVQFEINKVKNVPEQNTFITPQKKRKRKDKYAGLLPSAVISLDDTDVSVENKPVKKDLKEVLNDIFQKKKEDNEIKLAGKRKKKTKAERVAAKSVNIKKPIIISKKESKAEQKKKNKVKNFLDSLNKPKASNTLNNFLESL